MDIAPIQIANNSILIPRQYIPLVETFELIVSEAYLLIKPKVTDTNSVAVQSPLHSLIGIAETKDPTASTRLKEIVNSELDSQVGWKHAE